MIRHFFSSKEANQQPRTSLSANHKAVHNSPDHVLQASSRQPVLKIVNFNLKCYGLLYMTSNDSF